MVTMVTTITNRDDGGGDDEEEEAYLGWAMGPTPYGCAYGWGSAQRNSWCLIDEEGREGPTSRDGPPFTYHPRHGTVTQVMMAPHTPRGAREADGGGERRLGTRTAFPT